MRILVLLAAAVATSASASAQQRPCTNTTGLVLPAGFCATLFADSLVAPRRMDVAPNGDVIVAIRTARVNDKPAPGGVVILRDANKDGRAELRTRFGEFNASQVQLVGNHLYTENATAIFRYHMRKGGMMIGPVVDTIVSGLPGDRSHAAKTFVIHRGALYVNHGSPSNACQERDRAPGSKGLDPCPELDTRAGIWRFDANRRGQTLASGERFATGIRNAVAIRAHPRDGALYVVQHGRDMLSSNWPALFTDAKSAETPSEELFRVTRGADFGWPYCYHDPELRQRVLAPEYGGDGKTVGRCAGTTDNVGYFPAHWAPNDLLFYTGRMFPARYREGAFIVFHGSWNRAPLPQQGFKVVFQPMRDGRAHGDFEVVVDGFMDRDGKPTALGGRPMGLAQGPDGALYLSDDSRGRIWRITYGGPR